MKVFVTVIATEFAIAVIIAWAFEATPEGMKRTEKISPGEFVPQWCDMLPVSKDAFDGAFLINSLATIYALTGEKDLALQELEVVSKIPCGPSYADLRLDPDWDSLRGDPRFEKIVASLAPKNAKP